MERPLGSDEIREIFLRFFTERQHARIGSASIIPANDPTLLFINAGLDRLAALDTGPGFEVTGEDAFTLFATHGMPADLIRDFAAERGGSLDERRFADLFAEHRKLSRGTERGGLGGSPPRASTAAEPKGGPGREPTQL